MMKVILLFILVAVVISVSAAFLQWMASWTWTGLFFLINLDILGIDLSVIAIVLILLVRRKEMKQPAILPDVLHLRYRRAGRQILSAGYWIVACAYHAGCLCVYGISDKILIIVMSIGLVVFFALFHRALAGSPNNLLDCLKSACNGVAGIAWPNIVPSRGWLAWITITRLPNKSDFGTRISDGNPERVQQEPASILPAGAGTGRSQKFGMLLNISSRTKIVFYQRASSEKQAQCMAEAKLQELRLSFPGLDGTASVTQSPPIEYPARPRVVEVVLPEGPYATMLDIMTRVRGAALQLSKGSSIFLLCKSLAGIHLRPVQDAIAKDEDLLIALQSKLFDTWSHDAWLLRIVAIISCENTKDESIIKTLIPGLGAIRFKSRHPGTVRDAWALNITTSGRHGIIVRNFVDGALPTDFALDDGMSSIQLPNNGGTEGNGHSWKKNPHQMSIPNDGSTYLNDNIVLGKHVADGIVTLRDEPLPISSLPQSVLAVGMPDSGKTYEIGSIKRQACAKRPVLPVAIMQGSSKAGQELNWDHDLYTGPSDPSFCVPYCPLPLDAETRDRLIDNVARNIAVATCMTDPLPFLFNTELRERIKKGGLPPRISTVLAEVLDNLKHQKYGPEVQGDLTQAFENRAAELMRDDLFDRITALDRPVEWLDALRAGKTVYFELGGLKQQTRVAITIFLLEALLAWLPKNEVHDVAALIIIDEAGAFFRAAKNNDPYNEEYICAAGLQRLAIEYFNICRYRGISTLLTHQDTNVLLPALLLCGVKLIFRQLATDAPLLTPDPALQRRIVELPKRHAIVLDGRAGGGWAEFYSHEYRPAGKAKPTFTPAPPLAPSTLQVSHPAPSAPIFNQPAIKDDIWAKWARINEFVKKAKPRLLRLGVEHTGAILPNFDRGTMALFWDEISALEDKGNFRDAYLLLHLVFNNVLHEKMHVVIDISWKGHSVDFFTPRFHDTVANLYAYLQSRDITTPGQNLTGELEAHEAMHDAIVRGGDINETDLDCVRAYFCALYKDLLIGFTKLEGNRISCAE
jgi:hypothetical protein